MDKCYKVRDWRIGAVCGATFFACLVLFEHLQSQMRSAAAANGYPGPADELKVLDARFGYSVAEVDNLFRAWGPTARRTYILIELLDAFVAFPAYGGLFLVLLNNVGALAARKIGITASRNSYILVVLLVATDAVENALQLLLVLQYSDSLPPWWHTVAGVASFVNQLKWWCLRLDVACFLLLAAAALSPTFKPKRQ